MTTPAPPHDGRCEHTPERVLKISRFTSPLKSLLGSIPPALWAILLLAFGLRIYSLSHGVTFHPDERHIVMVTERLQLSDMNPRSFAYGSLPFYMSWGLSRALGVVWPSLARYDGLFLVGRSLAAFLGVASVLLAFLLAKALYAHRGTALLAALFTSINVFHVQLSRFFAVDIFLTAWCLVALYACVRVAQHGRFRDYLFAGAGLGLAIGTKISALTLLGPLGTAMLCAAFKSGGWNVLRHFSLTAMALVVAGVVAVAVEPYAILDYQRFLHDTREQTSMVQGLWRPPYTIQYEGTTPYLYVLEQMLHYTMGVPLALAALAGLLLAVCRQFPRVRPAELVVIAWVIPLFIAFAGLPVKFPRYFLPIYPALFVFAAFALTELTRALRNSIAARLRYLPLLVVVGWSAIYCAAFMRIYAVDHGYQLATRWIFQNVPPHSRILGVDWDDKLPLFLPGLDPRPFAFEGRAFELPLYERESPEKLAAISQKLAIGDYIIFPTARTYGSIPRVAHEYVFTTNFLQLLFAEKLGFSLVQTIKVYPRLGPLVFNDDLADESFSVYDHPKIAVFKKTEQLSPDELKTRILNAYQYAPLPTFEQIMLKQSGSAELPPSVSRSHAGSIVRWILVLQLLGLIGLPIAALVLPRAPDGGNGIAKVLGLVVVGVAVWVPTSFGYLRSDELTARIVTALLLVVTVLYVKSPNLLRAFGTKHFWTAELLYLGGFLLFAAIRSLSPDIFWGEKPMDFTFLNYFIRLETLPPQDPWAAGHTMRYYYFGTYLMALVHKIGAIDSAVGYNLAIATLAGLLLSSAYTAVALLVRRPWAAVAGAGALVLLSNLEVLRLLFEGSKKSFDLFWASSRLYTEPAITEYPLWALLFADLHAHVIALPLALTALALMLRFLTAERTALDFSLVLHRLTCGLLLGVLFATNTWDFISYGAVLVGILLFGTGIRLCAHRPNALTRVGAALGDLARDIPLIILGALPIVVPFQLASVGNVPIGWGFNQAHEFDTLSQLLRHLSHWIIPLIAAFLLVSLRSVFRRGALRFSLLARLILATMFSAVPVGLGVISNLKLLDRPAPPLETLPWDILGFCSAFVFLAVFAASARRCPLPIRAAGFFSVAAGILIAGVEMLFLMDRMNTVFKFYNAVWILLGLACASTLSYILAALWQVRPRLLAYLIGRPSSLALTALLASVCAASLFNVYTMSTFRRVAGPAPSLDGMGYLYWAKPHEAAAIDWMRRNIRGTPTILEAQGNSYAQYTRISMHTGLPTILGWEYHVQQRGLPSPAGRERAELIKQMYSAPDPESALAIAQLLAIDLIYVGPVERDLYMRGMYRREGLKKWDEHPNLFIPLFRSGDATLYKVYFSKSS